MPSFGDMVEQTIGMLNDYTGQTPQQCTLAVGIDADDLVLTVDDGTALGRGLVEVDEELVYVAGFDLNGNTATIPAWGRAQQGTTAAVHPVGARVTTTPRPPRDRVRKQLNQEIAALYPDLWRVVVSEQTAGERAEYGLPADARFILDIQAESAGMPIEWDRARTWRFNTMADPDDFPTGVSVTIPEPVPGEVVRIIFAAEPLQLVNLADDFAITGLHPGVADLVMFGAVAHLVIGQEMSRGQLATVEQAQRAEKIQTGSSLAASRFMRQEYVMRLSTEKRRLMARYPSRPHYEGV